MIFILLLFACLALCAGPVFPLHAAPKEKPVGGLSSAIRRTGLPLPRWASLRSNEVNLRSGPGTRYPVLWVYRRKGLPVEITAEFDTWRRIRDVKGTTGWAHQATLSGRRFFLVAGGGVQPVFRKEDARASIRAEAEEGAQGRLLKCRAAWCRVELQGYRGYMKRDSIWGVYPDETVD